MQIYKVSGKDVYKLYAVIKHPTANISLPVLQCINSVKLTGCLIQSRKKIDVYDFSRYKYNASVNSTDLHWLLRNMTNFWKLLKVVLVHTNYRSGSLIQSHFIIIKLNISINYFHRLNPYFTKYWKKEHINRIQNIIFLDFFF